MDRSGVQWKSGSSVRATTLLLAIFAALIGPPSSAQAVEPGDVVITEIMIAPITPAPEWFELYGTTNGVQLDGCMILNGPEDTLPADPTDPGGDWSSHPIEDPTLTVGDGDFVTLAKAEDCIVWNDTATACVQEADYNYSGPGFSNEDPEYLMIACEDATSGWVLVDVAPVDWKGGTTSLYEMCGDSGCSATLDPSAYDHQTNDDLSAWCAALAGDTFMGEGGNENRGTPGAEGDCVDDVERPGVGEVVFSEIMVNPARPYSAEWFELVNLTSDPFNLAGCMLTKQKTDDDTIKQHVIGESVELGPDATVLFATECIETSGGDDDDDDTVSDECTMGEVLYDVGGFTDDVEQTVKLICPGTTALDSVEVDSILFDIGSWGVREGHSAMFVPESAATAADDNDFQLNWCEAAFSQCFLVEDSSYCEYGTPGMANECLTDFVDWPDNGPTCRCHLQRGPAASVAGFGALAALGLLLAVSRRRS